MSPLSERTKRVVHYLTVLLPVAIALTFTSAPPIIGILCAIVGFVALVATVVFHVA